MSSSPKGETVDQAKPLEERKRPVMFYAFHLVSKSGNVGASHGRALVAAAYPECAPPRTRFNCVEDEHMEAIVA
jgi:hypothetical protein